MQWDRLEARARDVLAFCKSEGITLATAESCTGGMIAAALTAIPGSSEVVERGFVTYSNTAKTEMLEVPHALIARDGAVSESVARAMAEGAIANSGADAAIAVTGVAGPGGGSDDKPVGTVHIAVARKAMETLHREIHAAGDRAKVRQTAALVAMDLLLASSSGRPDGSRG